MAKDYSIGVNLIGRDVSASKALNQLGMKARSTGEVLNKMSRRATLMFASVAAGANVAVQAASDFAETTSKVKVVFGDQAKAIEDYAKTADVSYGLSQRAAMDAASTFALFGQSAGLADKDLTKFTTDLVSLSSDFASFYNTSPEDAITAIGAALRGENEPIRRYNVLLDAMTMKQEALRLGIISNTKSALTPQQKVLAANSLIFKQSTKAQGDFARTSEGLANQQRILTAQFENLKVELGIELIPYMLILVKKLKEVMSFIRENKTGFQKLALAVGSLAAAVIAVNAAYKVFLAFQIVKSVAAATATWLGFTTAVTTGSAAMAAGGVAVNIAWAPFLLTIAGIAAAFYGIKKITDKMIKDRKALLEDPNKIPSWSTKSNKFFPNTEMSAGVPKMAKGGIVNRPTLAMIGEAGPEAVVPLNKYMGMGGFTIVNQIQGSVVTQKELSLVVRNDIAQLLRRKGIDPAILGV
jgi:hypothetical protein